MDIHLERLLKQHRQLDKACKRVLEVNPRHPLIARPRQAPVRRTAAPMR